jgi:hypothetical protein
MKIILRAEKAKVGNTAGRKVGEEKAEKPQRVGADGVMEGKVSAEEEAADLPGKPTKVSKFGFAAGNWVTKKASATSIKLGSSKPEGSVLTLTPKSCSVAEAFNKEKDGEPRKCFQKQR